MEVSPACSPCLGCIGGAPFGTPEPAHGAGPALAGVRVGQVGAGVNSRHVRIQRIHSITVSFRGKNIRPF